MTRRGAFMIGGQALGGVAAAAVLLPVVGFSVAPILETPEETWTSVGALDEFDPTSYKAVTLTIRSGIGEAGKTTAYVRQGSEDLGENPDEYIAISTRCAHLGCPVRFFDAAGTFICPCHGGVYDFRGSVSGGPPVRPLDRFYTRVEGGQVEVGPRYSVNSEFERFPSYRDPAQDLDGIGQYLYPGRFSTPKLD